MRSKIIFLISTQLFLMNVACNNITDYVYNEEFSFEEINNDSLYNILLNNLRLENKFKLISIRDSVNSFDTTVNRSIKLIDSVESLLLLTPEEKRQTIRDIFHRHKSNVIKSKFDDIQKQFIDLSDTTYVLDSLTIRDVPLNLLRMSLGAELQNLKMQEKKLLIGISENNKENETQ